MPGFFEALSNLPPVPKRKHTVTVDGKVTEVDLQTKKMIMLKGEQAFTWKDNRIVEKPKPKRQGVTYRTLKKDKYGYSFHGADAHWPDRIVEGGFSWQIQSE